MGTKSNLYNDIVNFVANSTGKLIIEKITLQESLHVPHLVNKIPDKSCKNPVNPNNP